MADQVLSSVAAPTPTATTDAPMSMEQGAEALTKLRNAKATPEVTPEAPKIEDKQVVETDLDDEIDTELVSTDDVNVDDSEEKTDDSDETAADLVVFKLDDGTPVTAEEAKKGYLRQDDYTRKTELVSQLRSSVEERVKIVDTAAEFLSVRLPQVMKVLQSSIPPEPPESLRTQDAVKYWDQYNLRRAKIGEFQQMEREFADLNQAREQANAVAAQEKFIDETHKLLEKLPAWKDPKVARKERQRLAEYGRKAGYSDAELATIDHRGIMVLRDAALGARVRAAGGKKVSAPSNPTIKSSVTAGINGGTAKQVQTKAKVDTPKIDPNASNRDRFDAGVRMLAARRH